MTKLEYSNLHLPFFYPPSIIVDKMDKDKDGFVSKEELKDWIKHISRRYIYEDADSQWGTHDTNGDGGISWDEWFQSTYQAMAGGSCDLLLPWKQNESITSVLSIIST